MSSLTLVSEKPQTVDILDERIRQLEFSKPILYQKLQWVLFALLNDHCSVLLMKHFQELDEIASTFSL